MKKTYMIPTMQVVKIQAAHILAGSDPKVKGSTNATSGNLGRGNRFSDWDEEE